MGSMMIGWLPGLLTDVRIHRWLRDCQAVGLRARLDARPTIVNRGSIRIGDGFYLASRPVQSHLVAGRGATLSIGDDVFIGHGAAIAAHAGIDIGSGTRIGPNVIMIDTDFHVAGDRSACADAT